MTIETYNHLYDAMNAESASMEMRTKAEFLYNAMQDWPTFNLTRIDDFLKEFKVFFGSTLTINLISNKPLSFENNDIWRFESSGSIMELINYSSRRDGKNDLDEIIAEIVDYYKGIQAANDD